MKKRTQTYLRVLLFVGTAISLYFVPWDLLAIWLSPKADTIQEQVEAAILDDAAQRDENEPGESCGNAARA